MQRDLSDRDYVYCWADGIHFNLRLEDGQLSCPVLVGVRADGSKELVAVTDGERESGDAWAELLRDCRGRGMRAPVVMVGDGPLGLFLSRPDDPADGTADSVTDPDAQAPHGVVILAGAPRRIAAGNA